MRKALAIVGVVVTGWATSLVAGPEDFPRTESGKPDFSGTYDIATLTPYLRDPARGENAFVDPSEAAAAQDRAAGVAAADLAPKSPDRGAPEKGADVGAYNQVWMDPGSTMFHVDGKYPASILVDPPDGRLPQLSDAGKARRATLKQKGWFKNTGTAWWLEEGGAPYDDMETQPLVDRCLYLGVVTVPMQPIVYNNHKVIVQTENHVLILVEWMHWARVVRLDSEHLPGDMRSLAGDSIGWWEDDTLVVETTNFLFEPGVPREGLRVVERFSPLRRRPPPLPLHRARPGLRHPIHRRVPLAEDRHEPLRIRLPRRQLRHGQHPPRRSPARARVDRTKRHPRPRRIGPVRSGACPRAS